tara:strand:+ start:8753 stop:12511 length:3759 start_codon:yes stop_codon:yes gene_type:complete
MVKNYKNTNNIKNKNFQSLQQGNTFMNNKNRLKTGSIVENFEQNNSQIKHEDLLTYPLFRSQFSKAVKAKKNIYEGFGDQQFNSIDRINDINKENSELSKQLDKLYREFDRKYQEYQEEKVNISNETSQYLLRTGDSHNYHGKNVMTNDGVRGYVTEKGYFKRYPDDVTYQSVVGKNGCPRDNTLTTIEQDFTDLGNSMSPMIPGSDISTMKNKGRYVRIEGRNQYLHIQELEVYSGDKNISKMVTEIQDERADENKSFNCTGTVFYGKKYNEGDSMNITVGNSGSNSKTVTLPQQNMTVSSAPVNTQNPNWRDTFRTSVSGNKLTVTRSDSSGGWGQQLVLKATTRSNDIVSYEELIQSPHKKRDNTGTINCSNSVFGDPLPGTQKQCICKVQKGGAKVTTSSSGWNALPSYVVDGNKDDNQSWPNANHTQKGSNEWIELDLQNEYDITRITLYNRPDCCQNRLNGAKLKILNAKRDQIYPTISLTGERTQEFMIRTLPRGQSCGGEGQNVYVNKFPNVRDNQPTYLGCFADSGSRRMDWDGANYMTFDDCKQKAIDNKKTFFGLQDTRSDGTSACMLSNDIVKSTSFGKSITSDYVWDTKTNTSDSGNYLTLEYDGNITIKNKDNVLLWESNTAVNDDDSYITLPKTDFPGNDITSKSISNADCRDFCNDNNECVGYNSSTSSNFCWFKRKLGTRSDTNSWNFHIKGAETYLVMKNNGNLTLYKGKPNGGRNKQVLWSSNTSNTTAGGLVVEQWKPKNAGGNKYKENYLLPGQSLEANRLISSNNGKFIALMQSDGNFVIYGAKDRCVDKKDFIAGAPWANSIYMLNNTKFLSKKGDFSNGKQVSDTTPVYDKISLGECMSKCEESNECNSFSFGKIKSDQEYDTCKLYRDIPDATDNNESMNSFYPNNRNPFLVGWRNAGKIGYIDENSVLHEIPGELKGYENEYKEYTNTDSKYNDIRTGYITGASAISPLEQVKAICNNTQGCAGFVFNPTTSQYWLKNENVYPISSKTSNVNDLNLYIRKRKVLANPGCSAEIKEITSKQWENYQKGETYNKNMKCGLANYIDTNRLKSLEEELRNIIDRITNIMKNIKMQNASNNIESQREALLIQDKFRQLDILKKKIAELEPPREKDDFLDTTLNKKNQNQLPNLFSWWFSDRTSGSGTSDSNESANAGTATSSGSVMEKNECENQAACMDDLNTYNQAVYNESFQTLTTPFDPRKEDMSMLVLGTLGIIGTMFAFQSCSKCK